MNKPFTKSSAQARGEIVKIDRSLGLVFGFAVVSKVDGKPFFDLQGDHVPEEAILEASTAYAIGKRDAKDEHRTSAGTVVHTFPLTTDIAKALGIQTSKTGLLIAMKPSEDVFAKFVSGEYTGFSIGGERVEDEEVVEEGDE